MANQSEKVGMSQIQQPPKVVEVRWTSAIVAALLGRRVTATEHGARKKNLPG